MADSQMTQPTQMTQLTEPSPTQQGTLRGQAYTIAGVKVEFPTKAYPSQISMMNQVIQGLKQKKNCLLESPTGSGKTLALLCAALAWQRHQYIAAKEFNDKIDARQEAAIDAQLKKKQQQDGCNNGESGKKGSLRSQNTSIVKDDDEEPESGYFTNQPVYELTDDSDEDFKPAKRPKSLPFVPEMADSPGNQKTEEVATKRRQSISNADKVATEEEPYFKHPEKRMSVPKIFFGTRTHKQIAQITRELRKTFYKPVRSVVLGSREHACINPMLEGVPNKNEHCKELLDNVSTLGEGCVYHSGARKFGNFNHLESYGVLPGFDLEDLVKAGKVAKACPYYATRFLLANADIVFCPYNYLIDPSIRKSMNLELDGQIIIFDEAHNMEDASREAASFTLKQHEISKAMQDCEKFKTFPGSERYALGEIANMLSTFCVWIDSQLSNLKDLSFNTSGKFWTGTEIIAALQLSGLDEQNVQKCLECFKTIIMQRDKEMESMKERGMKRGKEHPLLPSTAVMIIENVFRLFDDMYKNKGVNRDDFRIALVKSFEKRRGDGNNGRFTTVSTLTLNVWCLNPAVAFGEIRDVVHSIVLTSGTLSPMQSFQSELGTPFPLRLEASHIIDKNQVWAGVLGTGPNGVSLNGSYQNAESLNYQDEVGFVVQHVCDTMPYGVLCFFSSYRVMDRLVERWKITGRYQLLESTKVVVIEPRSGASEFEAVMNDFYNAVKAGGDKESGKPTGGLFFAVCRGKVSEGLDFSDNNARAVICIGIPFPNYKDMQVELKRDYNQKNTSRGLLPGSDWYEIQAFRALNQALGRCIRHRQDWGAILLVDDRYIKTPRYIQSLSKWIRASVNNYQTFKPVEDSLECFRDEMLARPAPLETSFATQTYESSSGMQGGGGCCTSDVENVNSSFSSGFGTNSRQRQTLSTFSGLTSKTWDEDDSSDFTDFVPNIRPNSSKNPGSSTNSNFNKSNNLFPTQNANSAVYRGTQGNNSNTKTPGIAALFARQYEKSKSANSSPTPSDTTTETSRNKRAREKKIRL